MSTDKTTPEDDRPIIAILREKLGREPTLEEKWEAILHAIDRAVTKAVKKHNEKSGTKLQVESHD